VEINLSDNSDDDNEALDEETQLKNIANEPTKSKIKIAKTSVNHYKRYITLINSTYHSIDEIPNDPPIDLKNDMGRFSDYLFKHAVNVNKWKSHGNYIGNVFEILKKKISDRDEREEFEENYSRLRRNTEKAYIDKANKDDDDAIEHHKIAKDEQLEYISANLFNNQEYYKAAVNTWDYQSLGRISETHVLKWKKLDIDDEYHCLLADWYRPKTATTYQMHYVISPSRPWRCSIFLLGCLM
jgi:hypothetical protein